MRCLMRYGLDMGNKLRKQEDRRRPTMLSLPLPLLDTVDRQLGPEAVRRTELCYLIYSFCLFIAYTHYPILHSSLCHSLSEVIQSRGYVRLCNHHHNYCPCMITRRHVCDEVVRLRLRVCERSSENPLDDGGLLHLWCSVYQFHPNTFCWFL